MIPDSTTLYDINYVKKTSLQNYIMDFNEGMTVNNFRNNFINSCVASCVLCYILGVGDRHSDNILVTKYGELINIDFSYILGEDPKHVNVEMKITNDMLDMLGDVILVVL